MSYTPVIIVVFALFFLVSMLSYHTLRRYRGLISEKFTSFLEKSILLYDLLHETVQVAQKTHDTINNDLIILKLKTILKDPQSTISQKGVAERQLSEEMAVFFKCVPLESISQNPELEKTYKKLKETEKYQHTEKYRFYHTINSYNKFVENLPSSWVAKMFGFRKI